MRKGINDRNGIEIASTEERLGRTCIYDRNGIELGFSDEFGTYDRNGIKVFGPGCLMMLLDKRY